MLLSPVCPTPPARIQDTGYRIISLGSLRLCLQEGKLSGYYHPYPPLMVGGRVLKVLSYPTGRWASSIRQRPQLPWIPPQILSLHFPGLSSFYLTPFSYSQTLWLSSIPSLSPAERASSSCLVSLPTHFLGTPSDVCQGALTTQCSPTPINPLILRLQSLSHQ